MIEDLLVKVKNAKTRAEKQEVSAEIISLLPQFLKELSEIEHKNGVLLKNCIDSEGTKASATVLWESSEYYKELQYMKRIYAAINSALGVLNMFVRE